MINESQVLYYTVLVFDDTPHIMRKHADDPVFWSVKDIIMSWLRFIDDILSVFRGDQKTASWLEDKLNKVSPGKLVFTVDKNELEIVFLNLKLRVDRIGGRIETDHHVKETNNINYLK